MLPFKKNFNLIHSFLYLRYAVFHVTAGAVPIQNYTCGRGVPVSCKKDYIFQKITINNSKTGVWKTQKLNC